MEASGAGDELIGRRLRLEPDDQELCRAAAGGDHRAFDALVAHHAPALFRVALSLCGSRPDAEDICQETFIAAYAGLRRFDGRSSLRTWLTAILIRRAARLIRSRKRDRNRVAFEDERSTRVEPRPISNPADQHMDLLEAVRTLPEEFRDVVILREIEGYSYQEIADTLAIPCGTVQSRIHRARALLKEKLVAYRPEIGVIK